MLKPLLLSIAITTCAAAQDAENQTVSLTFEGGSAADYADAVRRASGGANIVVASEVELVEIGEVELNSASVAGALWLLNKRRQHLDDREIELQVDEYRDGVTEVYSIFARTDIRRHRPARQTSLVLSVAEPVEWGLSFPDVLSAVETSQDLFAGQYPKADIKFHESTGLIVARGHPEQMHNIQEVVENLLETAQVRALSEGIDGDENDTGPRKGQAAAGPRELSKMHKRLDTIEKEIQALTEAIERIERTLRDR